jgi:hypothetical protein
LYKTLWAILLPFKLLNMKQRWFIFFCYNFIFIWIQWKQQWSPLNEDDDFFCGHVVSSDDVVMSSLKNELQLICWYPIWVVEIENLLLKWVKHEKQLYGSKSYF